MELAIYRHMAEVEDRHWWFQAKRQIVEAVLATRVPTLPPDPVIVDAGCGTGENLKWLSRLSPAAVGMDPHPVARAFASERTGARVVDGALPAPMPFADGSVDLVTLLDVIEHLEDDAAGLAAVSRMLKPGGHALVTVPAFPFLWSPHDEAHHHFRRYTRATLVERLEAAGLDVRFVSYFNTWLFPIVAAIRLVKSRSSEGGDDLALPSPGLNRALEAVMASERHWLKLGSLPFGVSLVAVARKAEA